MRCPAPLPLAQNTRRAVLWKCRSPFKSGSRARAPGLEEKVSHVCLHVCCAEGVSRSARSSEKPALDPT